MQVKGSHSPSSFWSASTFLMMGLVVCFAIQQIVIVYHEKPYDAYLALSGYGMKSGHLWELFTYQFFHSGPVHLLINLVGLWFLGRPVEACLGSRRFLLLYLGASLTGAILQGTVALAGFLLPESLESVAAFLRDRFGGPVVGSSVGLCGVFAVFCRLNREKRIRLFFLLPIRPEPLLWVALGIAVLFLIIPSDPYLAHLAHLGGLLAGMAFIKLGKLSHGPREVEAR